jgi:hypothetical protein
MGNSEKEWNIGIMTKQRNTGDRRQNEMRGQQENAKIPIQNEKTNQ